MEDGQEGIDNGINLSITFIFLSMQKKGKW